MGYCSKLKEDGFVIVPNAISHNLCDAINEDFSTYVLKHSEEASQFRLKSGNHSRLCNMHVASEAARRAIFCDNILNVLDDFFEARAFLATSLYFEESSTQSIHRDTPFFNCKPRNMFAGVWVALEDVDPASGPLVYYPKSHRLLIDPVMAPISGSLGNSWTKYCLDIQEACENLKLNLEYGIVKKGDCIIWHPELAHGGSPIQQPGITRKSMVFHCAPEDVVMYGVEEFFGLSNYEPRENQWNLDPVSCRNFIPHTRPTFAHNN